MSRKPTKKNTTDTCSTTDSVVPTVDVVYKPFPDPHRALFGVFLAWAEKGAYFIMHDNRTSRYFHRHCEGRYGSPSKPDMVRASQKEPVMVIDLSRYPTLMEEGEWDAYLCHYHPEYKSCQCPSFRYVLTGENINREHYVLTPPYMYLTGLNKEGGDCLRHTKLIKGS